MMMDDEDLDFNTGSQGDGATSSSDDGDRNSGERGVNLLVNSAIELERLPMLEVILDRFCRFFSANMRSLTADGVSITAKSVISSRFQEYLLALEDKSLLCIFKMNDMDGRGLLTIKQDFIMLMLNIFLGGTGFETDYSPQNSGYTNIQKCLAEYFITIVFKSMKAAFSLITSTNFTIDRLEFNKKFIGIAQGMEVVSLMHAEIKINDSAGAIDIVFPHSMLEPLKELLSKVWIGDNSNDDMRWMEQFRKNVENSDVLLEAILGYTSLSIDQVLQLKKGQTVLLGTKVTDNIDVFVNRRLFCDAEIGSKGHQLALKVNTIYPMDTPKERKQQ